MAALTEMRAQHHSHAMSNDAKTSITARLNHAAAVNTRGFGRLLQRAPLSGARRMAGAIMMAVTRYQALSAAAIPPLRTTKKRSALSAVMRHPCESHRLTSLRRSRHTALVPFFGPFVDLAVTPTHAAMVPLSPWWERG